MKQNLKLFGIAVVISIILLVGLFVGGDALADRHLKMLEEEARTLTSGSSVYDVETIEELDKEDCADMIQYYNENPELLKEVKKASNDDVTNPHTYELLEYNSCKSR